MKRLERRPRRGLSVVAIQDYRRACSVWNLETRLQTHVTGIGLWAVVTQAEDRCKSNVAYASGRLINAEARCDPSGTECLAVVWIVKQVWSATLQGCYRQRCSRVPERKGGLLSKPRAFNLPGVRVIVVDSRLSIGRVLPTLMQARCRTWSYR